MSTAGRSQPSRPRPPGEAALFVRMPAELYEQLRTVAELEERSVSATVRTALRLYLEERRPPTPDEACTCPRDVCRGVGPDPGGCGYCWAKDTAEPCPHARR
jgi:hypothetical protein